MYRLLFLHGLCEEPDSDFDDVDNKELLTGFRLQGLQEKTNLYDEAFKKIMELLPKLELPHDLVKKPSK